MKIMEPKEITEALIQRFRSEDTINKVFDYQEVVNKCIKKKDKIVDLKDDIKDLEIELNKRKEQLKEMDEDYKELIDDLETIRSDVFDCVSNTIANLVNDEGV